MRKPMTALAAVFVFTACDGNPFDNSADDDATPTTDPGTTSSEIVVPDNLANNLNALSYDPDTDTMTIEMAALDTTPFSSTYARNLAAEAGLPAGYRAYSVQEDALDRLFVAVVKESDDGSVRAGVAADGGQFNRFFYGGHFERDGGFDKPDIGDGPGAGQVSYAGQYAGLTNYGGPLPVLPAGADPSLQMAGPGRVTGDMFLNVNFADMSLNGSIFNREHLDLAVSLDTIIIPPTDITDNGAFEGILEAEGVPDTTIGEIAGLFGGEDSISVGGVLIITDPPDDFLDDAEFAHETGVFVLNQCGMVGEDAVLCNGTAP